LCDLVRAVSLSCFPILIQGDTCVGKTSLITYLANASGNVLVRINNHEHTDLQEYIGSYSAQSVTGQLVFKEGSYWLFLCILIYIYIIDFKYMLNTTNYNNIIM